MGVEDMGVEDFSTPMAHLGLRIQLTLRLASPSRLPVKKQSLRVKKVAHLDVGGEYHDNIGYMFC